MGLFSVADGARSLRRLARFWDPDACSDSYGLTTFAAIKEGEEDELARYLDSMGVGPESPLARLSQVHCSRLHILRELVYQGGNQTRERLNSAFLIFTASFDGNLEELLHDMCALMPDEADAIWSHCVGYPGAGDPEAFRRYVEHNQVHNHYYLSPFPNATVRDVRQSLAVREQVAAFAAEAQGMDPATLQQRFLERFG